MFLCTVISDTVDEHENYQYKISSIIFPFNIVNISKQCCNFVRSFPQLFWFLNLKRACFSHTISMLVCRVRLWNTPINILFCTLKYTRLFLVRTKRVFHQPKRSATGLDVHKPQEMCLCLKTGGKKIVFNNIDTGFIP